MTVCVKICGITRLEDALAAADAGADLIGLNFWPGSPRHLPIDRACPIADAVRGRLVIVPVFVDAARDEVLRTAGTLGTDTVQLHGSESAEFVRSLPGLRVIKAVRVAGEADVELMAGFPASIFLLDARVDGKPGGTGRTIDWALARRAACHGPILLAGGLTPDNVGDAVRIAQPWGVDTAGGVETAPGLKDRRKIELFVRNAKSAGEGMM